MHTHSILGFVAHSSLSDSGDPGYQACAHDTQMPDSGLAEINPCGKDLFCGWKVEVENKGSAHSKTNNRAFVAEPIKLATAWCSLFQACRCEFAV